MNDDSTISATDFVTVLLMIMLAVLAIRLGLASHGEVVPPKPFALVDIRQSTSDGTDHLVSVQVGHLTWLRGRFQRFDYRKNWYEQYEFVNKHDQPWKPKTFIQNLEEFKEDVEKDYGISISLVERTGFPTGLSVHAGEGLKDSVEVRVYFSLCGAGVDHPVETTVINSLSSEIAKPSVYVFSNRNTSEWEKHPELLKQGKRGRLLPLVVEVSPLTLVIVKGIAHEK